ncbi:hypothetical protein QNH48_15230 [Neobacillus sp. YX16]|uniref:hypothetical protein n=1 Tax=Neobacillus sp. YX16 TaxID=3047874 RepID=UPI0024C33E6C|nr:hypothetical protein [Neobacillus sp. YX16]WHZ00434.1 hypothetical protein QNH48_15230 [Neobacillus sp. YX16]
MKKSPIASLTAPLSLTQVSSGMIYCMVLFLVLLFSVITGWGSQFEGSEGKPISNPQEPANQSAVM